MSDPKGVSWRYWLIVIMIGLLAGCGLYFLVAYQGDTFANGTYIGTLAVGGLTLEEAEAAVSAHVQKTEMTLVVTGPENYSRKLNIAAVGGYPDVAASVKKAWEQGKGGIWSILSRSNTQFPLLLAYKDKDVQRWLEQTRFDVDRKPTEPRVVWEGEAMRVAEPASGHKLDMAAAKSALPLHYQPGEYKLALKMEEVKAQVTSSELTGLIELASFDTSFDANNKNRTVNLEKAAAALNGTVVAPGGIFSFNDTVGPRDLANGYLEAMVIIKNEFTPGIGGGICQVSSTLYNAALLGGFPITERRNHSVAISYVPVGLDATVAYPYQDFKFKNDADSAVYINAYTRGSKLYVKLFGRRNNPISVKIERIVDQTTPFTVVQKVDPSVPAGTEKVDHEGVNGYKVRTYRVIMDQHGQVRERKLISNDKYAPLNKLVLVSAIAPPGGSEPGDSSQPAGGDNGDTTIPSIPNDSAINPGPGENILPDNNSLNNPADAPATSSEASDSDEELPEDADQM